MADDENAVSDSGSRTCPYCRETIDPQAMRCPHCQTWLTGEEGQPTSRRAGRVKATPGTWTLKDMGPADEDTVAPLTEKSCGLCRYDSGVWGFLKGAALGLGVRTCSVQQCWVAGNRLYCYSYSFIEDCQISGNPHSGWPMCG
jgi:hypothetical protein